MRPFHGTVVFSKRLTTCFFLFQHIEDYPSQDIFSWADGLLIVYSIIDRPSFQFVKKVSSSLTNYDIPTFVVANKGDMVHLRQVSSEEGSILARDLDCGFAEVTAAEQIVPVAAAFQVRNKDYKTPLTLT